MTILSEDIKGLSDMDLGTLAGMVQAEMVMRLGAEKVENLLHLQIQMMKVIRP